MMAALMDRYESVNAAPVGRKPLRAEGGAVVGRRGRQGREYLGSLTSEILYCIGVMLQGSRVRGYGSDMLHQYQSQKTNRIVSNMMIG